MPSAWGLSWGSAWGNAWGAISLGPVVIDHLLVITQPSGAVAGFTLSQQPIVHVKNSDGTLATGYSGRIKALLVSGNAQVIGDTIYAVAGVGTYTTLRLDGSGTQLIAFIALDLDAPIGIDADPIDMAPSSGGAGRLGFAGRRIRGRRGGR